MEVVRESYEFLKLKYENAKSVARLMRIDDVARCGPSDDDSDLASDHATKPRLTPRVRVRYAQRTLRSYPLPSARQLESMWQPHPKLRPA